MLEQWEHWTSLQLQAECSSPLQRKRQINTQKNTKEKKYRNVDVTDFNCLPENTSPVLTAGAAATESRDNYIILRLRNTHLRLEQPGCLRTDRVSERLTCRELLNGHRWHSDTLRPVSHLRLGEFGCRGAPFTLELLLSNSFFSGSLFLLLNLHFFFKKKGQCKLC